MSMGMAFGLRNSQGGSSMGEGCNKAQHAQHMPACWQITLAAVHAPADAVCMQLLLQLCYPALGHIPPHFVVGCTCAWA